MYLYDRKVLKSAAKNDLKGKYWISVLACLIVYAINFALGEIHLVASLLVAGPLGYGGCYFFTDILRNNEAKIENLFVGFKSYVSTLVLGLLNGVFVFLWTLLFVVPGIIKYIAYSMSFFIRRDNPEMTANECIKASIKLTDGHKGKIFRIILSYIGWCFLLGFACGIVLTIVELSLDIFIWWDIYIYSAVALLPLPLYVMSMARMYDFLILNYNEQHGGNDSAVQAVTPEIDAVATEEMSGNTTEEPTEELAEENPFDL